jgi:DNA-binding NarL/FixJ family response regulator
MPGDKLIQAIRDCMTGQLMMPAVIAAKIAARLASSSPLTRQESNVKRLKAEGLRLSEREKQIAVMMMQGNTNRQIAEQLFMSEGTVKNYISVIYGKIGISDRTKAILVLKELHTDHEAINSGG